MTTLARILAALITIIGGSLLWHTIMPQSAHWMTGQQIGSGILLLIILATGYTVCGSHSTTKSKP